MTSAKTARAEWKSARREAHAALDALCAEMGCTVFTFEPENAPEGPALNAWTRACRRFGDANYEMSKLGLAWPDC